ncbi:MAG: histidine phosphatase family protein [Chitinophagaceae bacterium]
MRTIVAIVGIVSLFSCATTKIYIVRHGDKASSAPNSDLKNPEGFTRARVLRDSLSGVGINGVYSTNVLRTIHTAEPAAVANSLPVVFYNNADSLIDALSTQKKKHFLVVGHSNTVPQMLRHIGLDPGFTGNIDDGDFDNLFVVIIKWSGGSVSKTLVKKTFGAFTAP